MLEETFSGGSSSNRVSISGSLTNLGHVVENKTFEVGNPTQTTLENNDDSETNDEIHPSMGFMRHTAQRRSTPLARGGSAHDDLDAVAMKKRLQVLATIEHGRSNQRPGENEKGT